MNMQTEPVRLTALIAGIVAAIGGLLLDLSQGATILHAAGEALLELSIIIGGGEVARAHAYAPRTYNDDVDAHAVIEAEQYEDEGL